jgi:hypothetical protein
MHPINLVTDFTYHELRCGLQQYVHYCAEYERTGVLLTKIRPGNLRKPISY